ncbi:hypothetical protein FHS26_005452 [Rhizobium pisi]|uniref:Uncharacterized protein n=1 Tax=Rhizobium pisi TaxID=574561 RepID=A0A7W5G290_9HYPH|nr:MULTISPECIES: hypothetical protein [Rhizobium]MBB3137687.1 hypothetical protein [Rhizobium pisi]
MPFDLNPFPVASNRHSIWEMLVRKDVGGFVAQDLEDLCSFVQV